MDSPALDAEVRETLLDIRREHPTAAAEMILGEVLRHGLLEPGQLSVSTLRRLFRDHDLPRASKNRAERSKVRRRWEADRPAALWHGDARSQAIERLVEAVSHRQHALVVGEPGVGKTTVLRALKARLSPVHFRCVYIPQVTLAPRDFYRQVCQALQVEAKATASALFCAIQQEVRQLHHEHRSHPVLVLDECQLMPDRTLSHLHVLANFDGCGSFEVRGHPAARRWVNSVSA